MDRFHQISAQIIRLYRQQLNLWVLGKIADLKDADLLQYDHRRDRIEEDWKVWFGRVASWPPAAAKA